MFLNLAARIKKSVKKIHVPGAAQQSQNQTKFKIRCNRFLYTLTLKDSDKADKLKQSLPPSK